MADCDHLSALLAQLAQVWEKSNRALADFDGSSFARHAEEESRICSEIEDLPPIASSLAYSAALSHLASLLRCRRVLLCSTQRTASALWGVCSVSRPTYEVTSHPVY
jgi:hypothetical protein